MQIVY